MLGELTMLQVRPTAVSAATANWTASVLQSNCTPIVSAVRTAAELDSPSALEIEAAMYDRGCGVEQNMTRAEELYAQAVAHGAKDGLARGYVDVYGSTPAEARGLEELAQTGKSGNALAAYDLYQYYRRSLKPEADLTFHWTSIGARLGDLSATAALGGEYIDGFGVPKNVALGRQYLDRAYKANVPDAMLLVGYYTVEGQAGYPKDRAQGFKLLEKAASLGFTRAKFALVQVADKSDVDDGRLTLNEATAYMQESAPILAPHPGYDLALANFYYRGNFRSVPDCAHAVPLFLKVVDIDDDSESAYDLGYCYYNGDGIARNEELALKYVKLAAQKGSPGAIAFLKESASSGSNGDDYARNYEGYHWSDLHPMNTAPLPGSPAAPGGH